MYRIVALVLISNPTRRRAELDAATLARAQRGDATAWRALIEHYQGPVFGLLGRLLSPVAQRDLVEDLAQETFLRAFRALPEFDPSRSGRLSSWILTIATRLALDVIRRRRLPIDQVRAHELDRAGPVSRDRLLADAVARAVAAQSPEHRAIILLREVYELEYDEIARALAISIGTVRSRLARARAQLRAALEEEIRD